MANQPELDQMNEFFVDRDAISKAVSSLTRALEPRLNEFATLVANRAVSEGKRVARTIYNKVREQPWYLVGAAAALLVVAAYFLRTETHDEAEEYEEPMRHLH